VSTRTEGLYDGYEQEHRRVQGQGSPKKVAPKSDRGQEGCSEEVRTRREDDRQEGRSEAAVKKAPAKKAAGPKLTPPQINMLETIAKVAEPHGFVAAKKPDQKTVDALLKHKLVKKGKKDDKTKNFFVSISLAGKKFLGTKTDVVAKA